MGSSADDDVAVLTTTAGLADVAHLDLFDRLGDRLAVRDLRLADVGFDLELAQHAVDEHFEVQLAHAADDRLAGLFVGVDLERGVFLGQRLQRLAHLVLVGLGLGLDRDVDDRLREVERLEDDRLLLVAQRVTGGRLLHADDRDDVARVRRVAILAVVGVHLKDATDALLAILAWS